MLNAPPKPNKSANRYKLHSHDIGHDRSENAPRFRPSGPNNKGLSNVLLL